MYNLIYNLVLCTKTCIGTQHVNNLNNKLMRTFSYVNNLNNKLMRTFSYVNNEQAYENIQLR